MRLIIVGFCAGVISLVQISFIPSAMAVFCLGILCIVLVHKWPYCLFIVGFCFGLSWASLDAQTDTSDIITPLLENKSVSIRVKIKGLPKFNTVDGGGSVMRFSADILCVDAGVDVDVGVDVNADVDVDVDEYEPDLEYGEIHKENCNLRQLPTRVRLSWYSKIPFNLGPDQIWVLNVRLKPPHGFANQGGFDYEKWLFHKHIRGIGKVVNGPQNRLIAMPIFSIDTMRQQLSGEIQTNFSQFDSVSLLSALVVGDQSFITSHQWEVLRATGTSHLFAISGLHIGLFAGLFYGLASWAWRVGGKIFLSLAAPTFASIVGLMAALIYSAAAGFSIPTLRTVLMLAVLVAFRVSGKQTRIFDGLLGAAFAVLLVFPRSPLDFGFWLSFAAVGIIFWVMSGRLFLVQRETVERGELSGIIWRKFFLVQWAIFVGLIPLLIMMFGQISLVSPFVNVVAVPIVSLVLVPMALGSVFFLLVWPSFGLWLMKQTLWIFDWAWQGLEFTMQQLPTTFSMAERGLFCNGVLVAAVIILLAPKALPYKWLALFALLPFLFPLKEVISPGQLKLVVFDVGHGLSVLARTQHHSLLFDAGNRYSATRNAGESIILPYLRHKGVDRIDKLILSHRDRDHVGGARSVVEGIPVMAIAGAVIPWTKLVSNPAAIDRSVPNSQPCRMGQMWSWDGVDFEILYPDVKGAALFNSSNNRSCVLKISGDGYSIVIPGDIERPVEEYLLKHKRDALRADLLIAPHHGSDTSSTSGFINAVNPSQVVFTAGYHDRFGHPKEAVIKRYQARQVEWFNSALTGSIEYDFMAGAKIPQPSLYRQEYKAYWRLSDEG